MSYVIAGWIVGVGSISAYALRLMIQGRRLAKQVPADRQRWMSTDEGTSRMRADEGTTR